MQLEHNRCSVRISISIVEKQGAYRMTGREIGMEEKLKSVRGRVHSVEMMNRESATVTGVTDVEAFNEEEIVLLTDLGVLVLAGEGLHIVRLDLDDGILSAEGRILAMEYVQENRLQKKGVLASLFK